MKTQLTFSVLLFVLFSSCVSQSKYHELEQKYDDLQNDVKTLYNEKKTLKESIAQKDLLIEKYESDPKRTLSIGKTAYQNKDITALDSVLTNLRKYHPEAPEYIEVLKLRNNLSRQIRDEEEKKEAARLGAVKKLKKEYDDVSGITSYYQPYFTHYINSNHISIYINNDVLGPRLRLKMSYEGEDWIFFTAALLSYDGGRTRAVLFDKYNDYKSDVDSDGGGVYEWINVPVDDGLLSYLKGFSEGTHQKMRLSGKYSNTRNLTKSEVQGIKDVLLAYDVLLEKYKSTSLGSALKRD